MINSSFGFNIEVAIAIHLVMNRSIWAMNLSNGSKENKKNTLKRKEVNVAQSLKLLYHFILKVSFCKAQITCFHPDLFNPLISVRSNNYSSTWTSTRVD